jgi:hypothetical protein
MKKIKIIVSLLVVLVTSGLIISFTFGQENDSVTKNESSQNQMVNLFVTHGHCSTPFAGIVENLEIITAREGDGDPLADMKISFEMNPNSFNVCAKDDLTSRIQTPGLFIGENEEKMSFRTTQVYTMGVDWYQVNGKMSIKGVEKAVKLFVTGIREPKDTMPRFLVLDGQFNLFDWGIDYDQIVNGKSDNVPTKWMHINMKIEMD